MSDRELRNLYFEWITQLVCDDLYLGGETYNKLLSHLYEREFIPVLIMDDNRRLDGLELRYRFSYEKTYESSYVKLILQNKPCSMLEMMAALAQRIEEDFMYDPDIGNRIPIWFWTMIDCLGLAHMNDRYFDEIEFEMIMNRFMNREYEPNGFGGLFAIPDCERDLRKVEIWQQACFYVDIILENEKE